MEAMEGSKLWAFARWMKNSKYFLTLEKQNVAGKYISQLQLSDGFITCDPNCFFH